MWRHLLSIAALCALLPIDGTRVVHAQAAAIPLSIGVSASKAEVLVGGSATVTVTLKNFSGTPVDATQPIGVVLSSDITDPATVTFAAGQQEAHTDIAFRHAGVARITATAGGFGAGYVMVIVKEPAAAAPAAAPAPPPTAAAGRTAAAAPHAEPAAPVTLDVTVMPQHVHPAHSQWRASVLLTAIAPDGQPMAVPVDTPVYVSADLGSVTPMQSRIPAGQAHGDPIVLTSDQPGRGTIYAWTNTGKVSHASFEYHQAAPVQLVVKALPLRDVNDGSTPVTVTIFLEDDSSIPAMADRDVTVDLISSSGTLKPKQVAIAKGTSYGEATLTSAASGPAEITAVATGFKTESATVTFVLPWMLVLTAGIGGFLGALIGTGAETFSTAWWRQIIGHLLTGGLVGLVFYGLALFGIIASIPAVSIPLARLPTTNTLGALVLGFFGGYWGRAWLPKPSDGNGPPAPAAPAGH